MTHLTYDMRGATPGHPQHVMTGLGITYQHATPQSMGDCWWFWNCENVPEKLPSFLVTSDRNPMECIGFGLNEETAIKIRDYKPQLVCPFCGANESTQFTGIHGADNPQGEPKPYAFLVYYCECDAICKRCIWGDPTTVWIGKDNSIITHDRNTSAGAPRNEN